MSLQTSPILRQIVPSGHCKTWIYREKPRFMNINHHHQLGNLSCKASKCYNYEDLSMHDKKKKKKKTNFYEVLSLSSENVGLDEIRKAYRRMALRLHPDVCSSSSKEESTKRFIELQKAYGTLSNPVSRKMHDYELMGLVTPKDATIYGMGITRRSCFPKEVWEKQLCGLKEQSKARMERKKIEHGCID